MMVLLVAVVGVLALTVIAVSLLALRLARRVARLESRTDQADHSVRTGSGTARQVPAETEVGVEVSRPEPAEYLITRVGEIAAEDPEPVPALPPALFADVVARETVVRAASLVYGLRRALAPETRNRIRFEMRREVKRSRKQRRADLRTARREWEARQRQSLDDQASAA
ncbi:hypothetical protein [Nocardioides sp.]|uniref:hypothetical protein n=1 Tax=Nocardioides sp. TaxID=35761 RepID=UPI003568E2E5